MNVDLPAGWASSNLGELGEYHNGAAFKPSDWVDDGIPIIRIQNLTDSSRPFNRTRRRVDDRLLVQPGDILVSWSATLDAFMWRRGPAWLNQHIFKVVSDKRVVDKRFHFYLLKQEIARLTAGEHLHGSTMKHINRGPFLAHRLGLPPLKEQKRIVAKLDTFLDGSNHVKDELARISRLIERYKQAVLEAAFSGDLTADWRGTTDLLGWKSSTIGNVIADLKYGTAKKCYLDKGITPVLRIPNIVKGIVDLSNLKYADFTAEELRSWCLMPGDILVIRSNGSLDLVGKAALVTDNESHCLYAGYLIRLRPNQQIVSPSFLRRYLEAPLIRMLLANLNGALLTGRWHA